MPTLVRLAAESELLEFVEGRPVVSRMMGGLKRRWHLNGGRLSLEGWVRGQALPTKVRITVPGIIHVSLSVGANLQ